MVEFMMEDMALPALFEHARKIHSASDSAVDQVSFFFISLDLFIGICSPVSLGYWLLWLWCQETLTKGIEALRICDDRVSKLGLFSANESKDDVSTANLKYLLVSLRYPGKRFDLWMENFGI